PATPRHLQPLPTRRASDLPSASMENTLQVGDRVLVNKLVYHFRGIGRGDIIVFSGQDSWGPNASPPSGDPVIRLFDDVLSGIGLDRKSTRLNSSHGSISYA